MEYDVNNVQQPPQLAATQADLAGQLKTANADHKVEDKPVSEQLNAKEEPVCRICLTEQEDEENPLLAPCKCAGSMGYIHHQCLQMWFHQRRVVKQSQIVTTYFWKNLECELCKTAYPYETRSLKQRKLLNIIQYDLPKHTQWYMVLESISSNTSKVIHVVNMSQVQKLLIGRGHDAHVRVTDISVSRLHAVLFKSNDGYYYLIDN